MRDHVRILGILNIVLSSLGLLAAVAVLVIFGGVAGFLGISGADRDQAAAVPILATIAVGIAIFLFALSLPGIIGGWGLLHFRPWARILMIVISVLNLLHVPFGTALGVYGLWVLLSDEGRRIFETPSQAYVTPPVYPAQASQPGPSQTGPVTYPPQRPPGV